MEADDPNAWLTPVTPTPEAPRVHRRHRWAFWLLGLIVLAAVGHVLIWWVTLPTGRPQADGLQWARFNQTAGLRIEHYSSESLRNEEVKFVLVGSKADIDRALQAAGFTGTWEPGVMLNAIPPQGADSKPPVDPEHAQDLIFNSSDRVHIAREIMRAKLPSGQEQLFVVAFTS